MSMEGEKSHMTERILNLTLEIIYLLTGENYIAFKLSDGLVTPKLRFQSDQSSNAQTSSISSIPQRNNKKKIQDVTSEMIELLTGEVPIRCQDVSVYFSMEEWQYLEGHKDLYKDIMVENEQPFILPNGSSDPNPPQRSAGPLHPQDYAQEHHIDQGEQCINIKLKKTEREEMDLTTDMKCKMEKGSTDTSSNRNSPKRRTGPLYSQEYAQENHTVSQPRQGDNVIKVVVKEEEEEAYMEGNEPCKQRKIRPEISTDRKNISRNTEERPSPSPDGRISSFDFPLGFLEENTISQDPHGGAHCAETSSDYCTRGDEESLLDEQCANDHPSASGSDETFPCPMCGGCFSQRAGININTGDMLYSCSKCGKCFTPKQRLIEQMRTNSGPKPYSCPQCRKGFPSKAHLVIHYRLHTGEKPYTCSECGKCFHQKSNLNHHQVIHLGEKPFSCLECGKRFLRKADLLTHQKTHMSLKPYSCPHCGKCYRSKSTVLKHQRIHMG